MWEKLVVGGFRSSAWFLGAERLMYGGGADPTQVRLLGCHLASIHGVLREQRKFCKSSTGRRER